MKIARNVKTENNRPVFSSLSISLKSEQKATGRLSPVNAKGDIVPFKSGSVTISSNDANIFTANVDPANEMEIVIFPHAVGKATGTVTMLSLSGKTITKTITVEVLPSEVVGIDDEAIDLKIIFTITMNIIS